MLDERIGWPATGREALIRSAVSDWRDSLIDPAAASRLLSLRPGRGGVIRVASPAAGEILAQLRAGATYTFRPLRAAADSDRAPGGETAATGGDAVLYADSDPGQLAAALRLLRRRSEQEYLDRGQTVLYLVLGTLTWAGADRAERVSPLLLVPARLVASGSRQPPVLRPGGGDPVINPALAQQLTHHGVRLPRAADLASAPLRSLLDAISAAAAGKDGWRVREDVLLACFPFPREAIYRDLLDHEHLIAAHPAVAALAPGGPGAAAGAGVPAGQDIAGRATPALPPLLLGADSAQRACVAAALAGRSFLLDGPPGTGKSQTIANMIGALLQGGKTVLLVSEKAAALDVVAARLGGAGLSRFLLELHSQHAAPAAVAASLGAALRAEPAPPADAGPARQRREQLTAYAHAVHRLREPLGYSLHDVLQMIAGLRDEPAVPGTGRPAAALTAESFGEIRRAAADLAAAWRPAAQGQEFLWRGVTEQGPMDVQLYQAASALEVLAGMVRANASLADVTGLTRPSDADTLAALLSHLWGWPEGLPDEWLTVDTLDAVDAAVAQLAAVLTAISARESQAAQAAGVAWEAIPDPDSLPAADGKELAALTPPCADASGLTAEQIGGLAGAFAADAGMLERRIATLSGLAGMLGLRPPATFSEAADLLTLARLAEERDRPERAWLSRPGYQAASQAGRIFYDAHRALAKTEAEASAYYTAEALHYDLDGLAQRFESGHHGLGRLSGEYRADRAAVAAFTRDGIPKETAQQQLGLAAAWQRAVRELAAAETAHAAVLGPYYTGRGTDFDRLGRALTHAATAVRCAQGQDLSQAAEHICRDAVAKPVITATAAEALADLSEWQGTLAPPPAVTARPELMTGTITDAIGWLRAHLEPLQAAGAFTQAASEAVGRQLTSGQARQLMALREAAVSARTELAARDAVFRELCGPLYAGADTDVTALRAALEWARQLRAMITGGPGPLTTAHLRAAESAVPTAQLPEAAAAWQAACAALAAAFTPERGRELTAELDDYGRGVQLLEAMFNDAGGREEWHAHQAARSALAALGLAAAADACAAARVPAAAVPQLIERAVLQDWAEYQLQTDPALAMLRPAGPGSLVSEYQRLDQALAAAAAEDVISACDARRPGRGSGEAAVIGREAEKADGQLPVRALLEQAPRAAQALKPCFLATPLAVSEHLPAELHFDVVIFDEASQVGAAAAINCIYRGTTFILSGDRQQLLPRPDSAGWTEEETAGAGGQPSILDLARDSGAYPTMSLRWHYRSRDEALIGFANAAFYGGRLIPVTGPAGDDPGVGVELLRGRGTCRSGPVRDNPQEAARVAQRVIHHYATRPGQSLGVVTFSEAQAEAVETAVARARQDRPDLDTFFSSDRLRGFFVRTAGSVQGDERDVVIISAGYGPDENGRIEVDFGPLAADDGWRWLNVASTRARCRAEIVTSIRADDIPESVPAGGLRQLRRYLSYAARVSR